MSDKKITRREAIKDISIGVSVIATLPVLSNVAFGQDHAAHMAAQAKKGWKAAPFTPKFFTADENRTLIELSERIIPADAHSPGAKAAKVNEYIDMVVDISTDQAKKAWRDGLKAINNKSQQMFGKPFADATADQQVELLKEISKNERNPQSEEEQFFRRIKNSTIDGYYTSEIGIHKELQYKGNAFLKEFPGCTHPEHQS